MEPIILLDLDTHDVNALVLEPAFNYDNIYQRNLSVYKFEVGITKLRMTHLSRPSNVGNRCRYFQVHHFQHTQPRQHYHVCNYSFSKSGLCAERHRGY